ncbi:MAG: hypothetical protein ISS31_03240 [Kiritimatiellae bacterium]|nr:hypothetical protein [Kiritimatiellia bacterium]
MNRRSYILAVLVVLATVTVAPAALQQFAFDRYQPILDRQPFGEVQPDPSATAQKLTGPVAPPFTKDLTMCAITEDDSGIQVGFVNVAMKPPKSYFLRIGEMEDFIELVDADYIEEMALLRKGEEEHWISMAGPGMSASGGGGGSSPASSRSGTPGQKQLSYKERLAQRRAARVRTVKKPELEGEELEKHLQDYQMDLIRKGMPPLPMELTPEMDAQLVEEGVLPPVDDTALPAQ